MIWKYRTEQDKEHVENYLTEKGLSFIFDERLPAFYIDDPDPNKHYIAYQYYYTTGRWGVMYNKRNKNRKHYMCRDVETLVNKYILKDQDEVSDMRKPFDKSVYDEADKAAKDAAFKFISTMNYTTVDTTERKDFDIVCKARTEIHHLYEVEVKYAWKGEWPESWTEIRIPHRKKRLLDKWKKEYPNALFTFMVFRNDCKKAWHIDANILLDCEVKEAYNRNIAKGEKFFHIPVKDACLVDIQ